MKSSLPLIMIVCALTFSGRAALADADARSVRGTEVFAGKKQIIKSAEFNVNDRFLELAHETGNGNDGLIPDIILRMEGVNLPLEEGATISLDENQRPPPFK